jgi:hypothetical protein
MNMMSSMRLMPRCFILPPFLVLLPPSFSAFEQFGILLIGHQEEPAVRLDFLQQTIVLFCRVHFDA